MSPPLSARSNKSATKAAVSMMPGGAPRVGAKNPLLVKDDIGKAKPSCFDLPSDRFVYGRPGDHDAEGAREVSMFWKSHTPSPEPQSLYPDFKLFHKRAASARVTNAKDLKYYRKEIDDLTPRYGLPFQGTAPKVVPSDVIPDFAYGKKVRPSTPIDDVMSHRFAEQAEDDLMRFYTEYRDEQERAKSQVRKISLTKASRGHATQGKKAQAQQAEAKQEYYKITKFRNIPTRIDNRRQKASHTALFEKLSADDVSNTGGDVQAHASDFGSAIGEDLTASVTQP